MFNWIRKKVEPEEDRQASRRGRERVERPYAPAKVPPLRRAQPVRRAGFAKGDRIGGTFQVYRVLGQGGFGTVLLVYDFEAREVCAIKTFRDELLASAGARAAFKEEASRWVDLGEHPFILTARAVRELSKRLFVKMDYIAPDEDGRVSLAHHLSGRAPQPISFVRQLEWGIQFCLGMEHANQRGVRCHRDIKPQNILITANQSLKISDFGLAVVAEKSSAQESMPSNAVSDGQGPGLSIVSLGGKNVCGTAGYIPPEIYRGEGGDVRSDIYSFGLVLWQMAAHSPAPPFSRENPKGNLHAYLRMIYEAQMTAQAQAVEGSMQPVIAKCLARDPADRYQTFAELREPLETLLWREAGRSIEVPHATEASVATLFQRVISLFSVERFEEALAVLDEVSKTAPEDPKLHLARSDCLFRLGRTDEALKSCEEALRIAPVNIGAHFRKATLLQQRGQYQAALVEYDQALARAPKYYNALHAKARCLLIQGNFSPALAICDQVIELQPKAPSTWELKGVTLAGLKRYREAVACFEQALAYDPLLAESWLHKGISLRHMNDHSAAMASFDKALEINPNLAKAWGEKGILFHLAKKNTEAVACFDKALEIDPKFALMWYNKGIAKKILRQFRDALNCFTKFVETARPQDQAYVSSAQASIQKLKQMVSSKNG